MKEEVKELYQEEENQKSMQAASAVEYEGYCNLTRVQEIMDYAKRMGLPVNKLICASNKNNVLTEFFDEGEYNSNREFYKTNSPSITL